MPPPNEGHNEPLSYEEVCAIKDDLQSKLNGKTPEIGIVLGSGLGGLGEHIEDAVFVDYKDVKHFPLSTVIGHKGRFPEGSCNCIQLKMPSFDVADNETMQLDTVKLQMSNAEIRAGNTFRFSKPLSSTRTQIRATDDIAFSNAYGKHLVEFYLILLLSVFLFNSRVSNSRRLLLRS